MKSLHMRTLHSAKCNINMYINCTHIDEITTVNHENDAVSTLLYAVAVGCGVICT